MSNPPPERDEWPGRLHLPPDNNSSHESESTINDDRSGGQTAVGPSVDQTVAAREEKRDKIAANEGKREITEDECESELGFAFPSWKKWYILTIIFLVQTSMNFNTSLYSNGVPGIAEHFQVSEQAARAGAAVFLITYGFGCELWAPWSEEFGRKPILQASLFLVNIFTLPVVLAPNFGCLMAGRALGGLSTAGGSVTLGMVADLYDSDNQQYAVAYIVFSSVGGSILGPIVGGFVEQYLDWQWTIWIQLIFGGAVQLLHLLTVPETRTSIMLNRIAKKRRESGQDPNVYGPDEIESFWDRFSLQELMYTWLRPFRMFLTEPIVLVLSLLSGFADALIFMCIQSFVLVYSQWHFETYQVGLSFIPIGLGYVLAWLFFIPSFARNKKAREKNPDNEHAQYESRMTLLLYLAPCLPIGLIIFAWTSGGPPIHWIGSMFGSCIIGIANYAIYMATIDYMICAYGPYSASATGGNGWARDVLAGILTVPATPFYSNIGAEKGMNLEYASTILFCISVVLVIAVYVIYWKGPELRKKSPFAQSLAEGTGEFDGRRVSVTSTAPRRPSSVATYPPQAHGHGPVRASSHPLQQQQQQQQQVQQRPSMRYGGTARHSSYNSSHNAASRRQSREQSRRNSGIDEGLDVEKQHHHPLDPIASVQTRPSGSNQ